MPFGEEAPRSAPSPAGAKGADGSRCDLDRPLDGRVPCRHERILSRLMGLTHKAWEASIVARTWKKAPLFALSLGLALTAAACSSGNSNSSSGNTGNASGSATTPAHLVLNADGTPNLKGLNIPLATAGSHP